MKIKGVQTLLFSQLYNSGVVQNLVHLEIIDTLWDNEDGGKTTE